MKIHHSILTAFAGFLIVYNCGCTSNEIGASKDVAQETIFQQYTISFKEGDENAIICARFRFAGDDGTTLVLTEPSNVLFDGVVLAVDSSEFEGAFYKKNLPFGYFNGNHHFKFTDYNNKVYNNYFSIEEFGLVNLPDSISKNESLQLQFKCAPLGPDDYIEIGALETDSAFNVTYSGKENTGFITIPLEELRRQKMDRIKLTATLYKKAALKQPASEGGIIETTYTLKPVTINLK